MGSVLPNNTNNNTNSNNTTKKYQVTIHGVTTVFSASKEVNTDHLQEHLTSIIPQNHELFTPRPQTNSHAQNLNHNFTEFITTITPLINNCIDNCKHSQVPAADDSPPFKFKTPRPGKPTVFDKHWKDHFNELQDFKNQHGHCFVSRMTEGHEQLGNWLIDQRRKFRKGKLTREQFDLLSELGVEWDRSNHG
mmetsp:Transcript_4748/g.6630  ORF Transcript_4748/g.6630 Transcript_4748/m.6630 type:complete len:192 (+) Transcript_4748:70-645(+)